MGITLRGVKASVSLGKDSMFVFGPHRGPSHTFTTQCLTGVPGRPGRGVQRRWSLDPGEREV